MTLGLTEDEKLTLLALPKLTIEDDPHPLFPARAVEGKIADYLRREGFDVSAKMNFGLSKKPVSLI
jgi:hypothetical protein